MRLKEFLQQGGTSNSIDNQWNTMDVNERANYIKSDLLRRGYTENQTAAILGNLLQENRELGTHTQNTSSGALGIAQWLGSRKKNIMAQGKHSSISGQLDFLDQEIKGKGAWTNNVGGKNAFFNSDNVDQLTKIFRKDFERPGEHEANDARRIKNAYSVLGKEYIPGSPDNISDINTFTPSMPTDMKEGLNDWDSFKKTANKNSKFLENFSVDTQKEFAENVRLENERLLQEQIKNQVEQENFAIQQRLEAKQAERQQILSMIPQAQSINSGNISMHLQNGGTIEYMQYGGRSLQASSPDELNSIKKMQLTYMRSPEYAKRLKQNGYDNPLDTKIRRMVDVSAVKKVIEPSDTPASREFRKILGIMPPSYYNPREPENVNLSRDQSEFMNVKPSTIVAHELGHAETKSGLSFEEKEILNSSMNPKAFTNPKIGDHDKSPYEVKADINAIRYNLYKTGNFDPTTGKWKTKDGKFDKKFLEKVKDDFGTKRLRTMYNDDELKFILDTIAQNDGNEEEVMYAQKGGKSQQEEGVWNINNRNVDNNDIKSFYSKMINSSWYKERLGNNGYGYFNTSNDDLITALFSIKGKDERINKVIDARNKNVQSVPVVPGSTSSSTSYWRDFKFNDKGIDINPWELNRLGIHPRTALAHEYGHAETDSYAGKEFYKTDSPSTNLSEIERQIYKDNQIQPKTDMGKYVLEPKEAKGDVNAIRYNLYKSGNYDPSTGKFKTKDGMFNKQMILPIKTDAILKRMLDAYGEKGLIEIMNRVAFNPETELPHIAKMGGKI